MEKDKNIGALDNSIITDGPIKEVDDMLSIAVAHNRVVKAKIQTGQTDVESIRELARLVADAPENVIKVLYPESKVN